MLALKKLPVWNLRFINYVRETSEDPECLLDQNNWSKHSCVSWAAGAVEAMTGENPYSSLCEGITTPLSAVKLIKQNGFNSLSDMLASMFEEVPVTLLQKGDITLSLARWDRVSQGHMSSEVIDYAIGIADPPYIWLLGEEGVGTAPLYGVDGAKRGFRLIARKVGE
jgi:hypothetical protein